MEDAAPRLRFYSVQGESDLARLAAGGEPWPIEPHRASLGRGFYSFADRDVALSYKTYLETMKGYSGLRLTEWEIGADSYQGLRRLDLRAVPDDVADAWMGRHSSWGDFLPHEYEHIIRGAERFGPEYFFSADVFGLFSHVGG